MQVQNMCWAGVILMFAMIGRAQAIDVNEPYAVDATFGNNGVVLDPLVNLAPSVPPRASGQRRSMRMAAPSSPAWPR